MVAITVDGQKIEAAPGSDLLTVCLQNGIYIPHLCHLPDEDSPAAACRLCFVDIEGVAQPVTACTVKIKTPISVRTDSPEVRRLQRAGFKLLLTVHKVACKECPANRKCELQRIGRFLKSALKAKDLPQRLHPVDRISEHPVIDYWPNRCVLCGLCVHACRAQNGLPELTFARRGIETLISYFALPDTPPAACDTCRACIDVCPVAALTLRAASDKETAPTPRK